MGRTKISKKRKAFSLDDMTPVKIKAGAKTTPSDPDKYLRNEAFIMEAVADALWSGDLKAVKEILKSHYEALDLEKTLKRADISRHTFYDALSESGNPTAKTLVKIMSGLKRHAS